MRVGGVGLGAGRKWEGCHRVWENLRGMKVITPDISLIRLSNPFVNQAGCGVGVKKEWLKRTGLVLHRDLLHRPQIDEWITILAWEVTAKENFNKHTGILEIWIVHAGSRRRLIVCCVCVCVWRVLLCDGILSSRDDYIRVSKLKIKRTGLKEWWDENWWVLKRFDQGKIGCGVCIFYKLLEPDKGQVNILGKD